MAYDKNKWRTPQSVFDKLNAEFNFGMDAAASDGAQKCPIYIPPEVDSLTTNWRDYAELFGVAGQPVWLNPPFNPMGVWADRAIEMFIEECMDVVIIGNSATDTKWFYNLQEISAQVRFTRGRIGFVHPETDEEMNDNNKGQAIFVLSHTRKYDERFIWIAV